MIENISKKIKNLKQNSMILLLLISVSSCETSFLKPKIHNDLHDPLNPFCINVGKIPQDFVWDDVEQTDSSADWLFNYDKTYTEVCP